MSGPELREQLITLAGAPALVASTSDPAVAAARGTVLVLHGFTASKEVQRTEAHALAAHGYLAVTLDAVGHGARRYPDFEARFATQGERQFFDVVQRSADELPGVLDALRALGWAHAGRIGACGISMGGYILFGAITARCAIDAVAAIVASPRWRGVPDSPHHQIDRYAPTALLMHTASDDVVVPPDDARELHRALVPRYAAAPDRLRYVEHAGEGHMLSEATWHVAWADVLAWFRRHLAG
jgi:uncharacterized protein